jgi:capsular exopolysaccharide synthesis family protein
MPTTLPLLDEHLVALLRPSSWEAEPYRTLRLVLEQARGAAKSIVIAISSAAPGDGKTTTALNIAAALAEAPRAKVLVVDADLRRGTVAHHLGLEGAVDTGPGVTGAVRDSALTIDDVAWSLAERPFSVVPTGPLPETPYEVLESPRLGALLEQAREEYDSIIIDTPPFVPFIDCRVLSRWVDAFVLVVAAHRTPRGLVEETLNAIEPGKLLGLIFNGDDGPLWGTHRYYRYYRAAGEHGPRADVVPSPRTGAPRPLADASSSTREQPT